MYSVEVENSSVVAVIHNPTNTKAVMPEDTGITTAFKLIKNWSDVGACFQLRKLTQPIHDFFDEDQGPHTVRSWSGHDADFLQKVDASRKRIEQAATCSTPTKRFREEDRKKAQEETAKKARASLRVRMDTMRKSREMVIE